MALSPVKGNIAPPTVNSLLQANPGDRISADKSEVAPVVAILSRQLPLPQAQQFAGQQGEAKVLKSAPNGQTELEFQGQQLQVKLPPGRTLTAGELITVAFALNEREGGPAVGGAGASKKTADVSRLIEQLDKPEEAGEQSPSFVDKLSSSARMIGLLDRLGDGRPVGLGATLKNMAQLVAEANKPAQGTQGPALLAGPLSQATDALAESADTAATPNTAAHATAKPIAQDGAHALLKTQSSASTNSLSGLLAKEVSQAVQNSGLFYESHLQQWANGERSKESLALEPQARFGPEQVIAEKSLNPEAVAQSVKLVSAQLAALDQSRINLAMQGLLDKPVEVEIQPDERQPDDPASDGPEAPRPWVAKLKLQMEHLGELEVKLRMVGTRCDVLLSGNNDAKTQIDPHWRDFQEALAQKGLQLTHGVMRSQVIDDE